MKMISKSSIIELINDKLETDGYFLVSVEVKPTNAIYVLIDGEKGVSIDYCVEISRLIESSFNREEEDFSLEVSSSGLGSPFKVLRQYKKNIGKEVEVLTNEKVKITGILADVNEDFFIIHEEKEIKTEKKKEKTVITHNFGYNDIKSVKEIIRF